MSSYKSTPLYGGAITVDLPARFADASTIRQVPDNQEVFLDSNGYASIVFDILEHVHKPTHEEALQYHFQDLVEGTGDATNVLSQTTVEMAKVPNTPTLHLAFLQTPQNPNPRRKEPEFVAIHLLLLRLKHKDTDIVITVNEPHYAGEYEKAATEGEATKLMNEGAQIAAKIVESFEVSDWGLFDGE